jgi:hypothetical protein
MHGSSGSFGTLRVCAGVVLKRLGNVEEQKQADPIFRIQTVDSSFVTVRFAWTLTQLAIVCNMHTIGTHLSTALIRLNPACHAALPERCNCAAQWPRRESCHSHTVQAPATPCPDLHRGVGEVSSGSSVAHFSACSVHAGLGWHVRHILVKRLHVHRTV